MSTPDPTHTATHGRHATRALVVGGAALIGVLVGASQTSARDADAPDEADETTLACLVECAAEAHPTNRATCRLNCDADADVLDDPAIEQLDVCYDACRDEPRQTDEASCRLQCAADFYTRIGSTSD